MGVNKQTNKGQTGGDGQRHKFKQTKGGQNEADYAKTIYSTWFPS